MININMIENVLNISHDIYMIYLKLFELEVDGNKGNERYLSLVRELEEKIKEEKELYKMLSKDKDSFNMLYNYVKCKSTQLIYLRMYNYMFFEDMDISNDIEFKDDYNFRRLHCVCNRDLFLVFLSFIQDNILNDEYFLMRRGLIYTKYYNSFINLDLEEFLIENKFEVSKINYIQADFVSRILLMDKSVATNLILDNYREAVVVSIVSLLNTIDYDYDNEDKMVDIISSQCMLRASLSLLSNEQYKGLKDGIYKILNELTTDKNKQSVMIINSIMEDRIKDKSRTRKVFERHLGKK